MLLTKKASPAKTDRPVWDLLEKGFPKDEKLIRTRTTNISDDSKLSAHLAARELTRWTALEAVIVPLDYHSFNIPKRSGGLRKISAPNETLKQHQQHILNAINISLPLEHDAAYAYVKNRSTLDAMKMHRKSHWFLKVDIKDFFPSCKKQLVEEQLSKLYPIACENFPKTEFFATLEKCFQNGALPQGAPTSPKLSNLTMLSYDYEIMKALYHFEGQHFVYTRYADDILISSTKHFNPSVIIRLLETTLPFRLNKDKTKYKSINGPNWNLGLMLNQEHHITTGHKKKKRMKNIIHNLLRDIQAMSPGDFAQTWTHEDLYTIAGQMAYMEQIEKGVVDIKNWEQAKAVIKVLLHPELQQ